MGSEKYVGFTDSFLREGKPFKPKTLLFNIRVQENQKHNHQITSLVVESPFHCFWGKRKQQNFYAKNLFFKMEGVSACKEKGSVKTTTTI